MKRAQRGRRCAGLLNLIGNWEEEEYCRSYLTTLGGGVRRFDGLVIQKSAWSDNSTAATQQCMKRKAAVTSVLDFERFRVKWKQFCWLRRGHMRGEWRVS